MAESAALTVDIATLRISFESRTMPVLNEFAARGVLRRVLLYQEPSTAGGEVFERALTHAKGCVARDAEGRVRMLLVSSENCAAASNSDTDGTPGLVGMTDLVLSPADALEPGGAVLSGMPERVYHDLSGDTSQPALIEETRKVVWTKQGIFASTGFIYSREQWIEMEGNVGAIIQAVELGGGIAVLPDGVRLQAYACKVGRKHFSKPATPKMTRRKRLWLAYHPDGKPSYSAATIPFEGNIVRFTINVARTLTARRNVVFEMTDNGERPVSGTRAQRRYYYLSSSARDLCEGTRDSCVHHASTHEMLCLSWGLGLFRCAQTSGDSGGVIFCCVCDCKRVDRLHHARGSRRAPRLVPDAPPHLRRRGKTTTMNRIRIGRALGSPAVLGFVRNGETSEPLAVAIVSSTRKIAAGPSPCRLRFRSFRGHPRRRVWGRRRR